MVFSCYSSNIVRFINKEGIELFQIPVGKDKTGSGTLDTVTWVVIVQLPSSGLVYLFFGQKPSHKALIQQLKNT
jgi:hypothetical protein